MVLPEKTIHRFIKEKSGMRVKTDATVLLIETLENKMEEWIKNAAENVKKDERNTLLERDMAKSVGEKKDDFEDSEDNVKVIMEKIVGLDVDKLVALTQKIQEKIKEGDR